MRNCLILNVVVLSAVALALPISAQAKNNSPNLFKSTVKGEHIKQTSLHAKKSTGEVTGPVKPKSGVIKIDGESQDAKHRDHGDHGGNTKSAR